MNRKLPPPLMGGYIAGLVLALLIGCCSAYSVVGVAGSLYVMSLDDSDSDAPFRPELHHTLELMMRIQAAHIVLMLITAIALGTGCGLGLSGRRVGRPVALGAFALVVIGALLNLAFAVWSQVAFSSMLGPSASSGPMAVSTILSMVPTALWMLLRLAVAGGGAAALFTAPAREYYANVPDDVARGSRE